MIRSSIFLCFSPLIFLLFLINHFSIFLLIQADVLFFLIQLRTAREAVKISAVGGIIGAVSTAGVTWKYSRSLHGMFNLNLHSTPYPRFCHNITTNSLPNVCALKVF